MWLSVLLSLAVVIAAFIIWICKRRFRMALFKRNGINGPEPHWIWGNMREYMKTPNVVWDSLLTHSYGPICGYFIGAKPQILVTDLNLLEEIQRRQGNQYLDRPRRVPGGINPDPKRAEMLGNLKVPQWKALRAILNKGFSPSKLSKMSTDARTLIEVFTSIVRERRSVPIIDFYELYQNLTLDFIGKAGFGIDSDIQQNPNDALKSAVEQEFSKSTSSTITKLYLCFPEVQGILQPIRVFIEKAKQRLGFGGHSELWDLGLVTVNKKKRQLEEELPQDMQPPSDLVHLMIASGRLSEMSIVANSVLFFEAGFETLSASLAFITHLLMTHRECQDNVRNEISDILRRTDGEIESVSKLNDFKLLDAVIKEGLRMYPPQTTFIGRSGEEDLTHTYRTMDGSLATCTIPKNTHIQVGLYQILNSSAIWEAPREFRPQRFLSRLTPEQAIAYQPFGKGKRICIGRKYADMVLKMVLIQLLSRYLIVPIEEGQPEEIEVVYKTATMTPKYGVVGCVISDPLFPMNDVDSA